MLSLMKNHKKLTIFLMTLLFFFIAPILFSSATYYWKITITVEQFQLDSNLDWPWKMEVGFTFYVSGYLDNAQFCVFTKDQIVKDTLYDDGWSYTTPFGFPQGATVVWYFYEDDSSPLYKYNGGDDMIVFAYGENPFVFTITGSGFSWDSDDHYNPDAYGSIIFSVSFTLTTLGPPE